MQEYEKVRMDIIFFDAEDVITASEEGVDVPPIHGGN
jgi:hypothetical protein